MENNIYKMRLLFLSQLSSCKTDLDQYLRKHEIKNILEIPPSSSNNTKGNTEEVVVKTETNGKVDELLDLTSEISRNGNGKNKNL